MYKSACGWVVILLLTVGVQSTSPATVKSWANAISVAIDTLANQTMRVFDYQAIVNKQPFTLQTIDGTVVAATAAAQLAHIFDKKSRSLNAMSDALLAAEHSQPGASSTPVSADVSAASIPGISASQETSKFFSRISMTSSTTKTAPESVAADTASSLHHSAAALEPVFKQVARDDSEVGFQYFGSESGAFRVFPGSEWVKDSATGAYKAYDPRLTPWYARAVSGAKNLVLLLHATASTDLPRAVEAMGHVLSTVSPDDTVAVVVIADGGGAPSVLGSSCLGGHSLSRGTPHAVQTLRDALATVISSGGGSSSSSSSSSSTDDRPPLLAGYDMAFNLLRTRAVASARSACTHAILLFSGDTTSPLPLAYLSQAASGGQGGGSLEGVMLHVYATSAQALARLKPIACAHMGVYAPITTASQAREAGRYYRYLRAPPLTAANRPAPVLLVGRGLRPDLLDAATADGVDALASGYSLYTAAVAVYSHPAAASATTASAATTASTDATAAPTLLGVVALDFAGHSIKDALAALRQGRSFALLVGSGGETLYHPLQARYKQLHLVDVGRDISRYERFPGWDSTVRPGLLSGDAGQASLTVDRPFTKGDALYEGIETTVTPTQYFWAPVRGTQLVVAMVYAEEDLTQRQYSSQLAAPVLPDQMLESVVSYPKLNVGGKWALANVGNCPGADGATFGNCAADAYCAAHNQSCGGSCTCESHRWPVGTIVTGQKAMGISLSPRSYADPTAAASLQFGADAAADRARADFLNAQPYAVNGAPHVTQQAMERVRILSALGPVFDATHAAGLLDETVWAYCATSHGVYTKLPAGSWGAAYDPTRRPWYHRAVANPGKQAISTPYIDAGGAGLMNTLARVVYEASQADLRTPASAKVFGVEGMDFLYPAFHAFVPAKTAAIAGGCSTKPVHLQRAGDAQPMCFLLETAGLLLSHSDFLVSQKQAESLGAEVTGEVGTWAIENVFLGLKEAALARALLQAGFFRLRTGVLNEDSSLSLEYFVTDPSVIPAATGVLSGSVNDPACMLPGATWSLSYVQQSNAYLLAVDGYQRAADYTQCPPLQAAQPQPQTQAACTAAAAADATAAAAAAGSGGELGAVLRCSGEENKPLGVMALERARPATGKCAVEAYVSSTEGLGQAMFFIALLFVAAALALLGGVVTFRRRYALRAASPSFCALMCVGGMMGYAFLLLLLGRPTDAVCAAQPWVGSFAFVLLFGPLFAKTHRIHRLFNNSAMKQMVITNADLLRVLAALALAMTLLQGAWTLGGRPRVRLRADPLQPLVTYVECVSDHFGLFAGLTYAFMGAMILAGCALAFKTRHVDSEFNESKQISLALYNLLLMGAIVVPLVYGLQLHYSARFTLIAIGVLLTVSTTLAAVLAPKFTNLAATKLAYTQTKVQPVSRAGGGTQSGLGTAASSSRRVGGWTGNA